MIKKLKMSRIIVGVLVFTVLKASAGDNEKARRAIQMINHINCAVSEITQSKDKFVLEREYNALTVDSLKLDSIDDEETVATIKSLMNAAKKLRFSKTELEMMQEDLEQELNDALLSSMPNLGSLASPNLLGTAVNLVTGAAGAYINYEKQKKAIEKKRKKMEWTIKKSELDVLDSLNQDLLDNQWRIIKDNRIDDYKRVTAKQITDVIDHFKDLDKKRRHSFFQLHESEYRTSTRYWYYRAVAASEVNNEKDTLRSLEEFQKIHLQINRKDKIAALVSMMKVQLLLKSSMWKNSEIRDQLKIVEDNADLGDWNLLFFCGLVYGERLSDIESARRVLNKAINELSFRLESRLSRFRGDLKERGVEDVTVDEIPSSEALMTCRMRLQMLDSERRPGDIQSDLIRSIEKENAFIMDALYYVGRTKDRNVFNKLLPYIVTTTIMSKTHWGREDSFYVNLPVDWFQAGDLKPTLTMGARTLHEASADDRELRKVEVLELLGAPAVEMSAILGRLKLSDKITYVRMRYRHEIDKLDGKLQDVTLTIPHRYCKVKMTFRLPKNPKGEHVPGVARLISVQIDNSIFGISDKIFETLH